MYLAILILAAVIIVVSKKATREGDFQVCSSCRDARRYCDFLPWKSVCECGFLPFMSAYALWIYFYFWCYAMPLEERAAIQLKGICYGRLAESLSMPLGMFLGLVFLKLNMAVDESTPCFGHSVFFWLYLLGRLARRTLLGLTTRLKATLLNQASRMCLARSNLRRSVAFAIERYGLSPREAEVMLLITRGRRCAIYIRSPLYGPQHHEGAYHVDLPKDGCAR